MILLCNTWYNQFKYYKVRVMRIRNLRGQFTNKSDSDRYVRSIRVTDEIWNRFGEMAAERCITRADLLEEIVKEDYKMIDINYVVSILKEALILKANAGGAIKKQIRKALVILRREY